MEIRKAEEKDLPGLAALYKDAFMKHNIFSKPKKEVLEYLNKISKEAEILVAVENNEIVGGVAVFSSKQTPEHNLSRLKHVAVLPAMQGKGTGKALVEEAEKIAGKGKIEIHVAEREQNIVDFYKKLGYEVEGELASHYRPGETCYILGKVVS